MAITPDQIGEAVAKAIPGFFNDAIDQLRDGEGAYIRDGMPEGIVGQVGQAVARSACRQYAAQGPDAVGSKGERFERACRPYLDTLDPGDGAEFKVPFEGAQCLTGYLVNLSAPPGPQPGTGVNANNWTTGPIVGFRIEETDTQTIGYITSNSGPRSTASCQSLPVNGIAEREWFRVQKFERGEFSLDVTAVCSGGIGDCGNPPPVVVQPRLRPDPLPPPFRFNPGDGIDIPINVDINPDGTINVDFGGDPVTVDPFPEDDGGGGGGGGGGAPGDPTDPGAPGQGGDTGNGGDAAGQAGEDEELVGVLVEVLQAPQNPNVFANNSDQPFRGIGYVRMGYPNRLGTDISGGTVISPQFFHAQQRGLTNWAVSANTGFNLRTTPYYRSIEVNV